MRRRIVSAGLVGLVTSVALLAQTFDLRTGSWSITMTVQTNITPDGLSPEARAQREAELRKPLTFTNCVTAEDVKNLNLGKTDGGDDDVCKTVSMKVTTTTADMMRECPGDDHGTEVMHLEAATPQVLKGTITTTSEKGTMVIDLNGKWVGATCTD